MSWAHRSVRVRSTSSNPLQMRDCVRAAVVWSEGSVKCLGVSCSFTFSSLPLDPSPPNAQLGTQKSFKSCVISCSLIKGQFGKTGGGTDQKTNYRLVQQKMRCLTSSVSPFRDLINMANLYSGPIGLVGSSVTLTRKLWFYSWNNAQSYCVTQLRKAHLRRALIYVCLRSD